MATLECYYYWIRAVQSLQPPRIGDVLVCTTMRMVDDVWIERVHKVLYVEQIERAGPIYICSGTKPNGDRGSIRVTLPDGCTNSEYGCAAIVQQDCHAMAQREVTALNDSLAV